MSRTTSCSSLNVARTWAIASDLSLMTPPALRDGPTRPALEDHEFALFPENASQDPADLADRQVIFHALDEHGHEICIAAGRFVQVTQQLVGTVVVSFGAHFVQALHLAPDDLLPHPEDLRALFLVGAELVDADDHALAVVHGHLIAVGSLLYLALLIAHFDGP